MLGVLTVTIDQRAQLLWVAKGYDVLDGGVKRGEDVGFKHLSSFLDDQNLWSETLPVSCRHSHSATSTYLENRREFCRSGCGGA
jgi:hypothetical protein